MFNNRFLVEEKMLGKHECPSFTLSKWEEARIHRPWQKGLIVKLLGSKIGFKALETRLNQIWVSNGVISIIDLGCDFFLVMFTSEKDRDFALGQGPWLIYDHYLTVREWRPNFQPELANIDKVAVWVRFSGLPIEYYDPSFLHFVGNRIGRTVKVDKTTLQQQRGKYARLCVEVDLKKPLLAVFEIKEQIYKVEYEGLHLLCLRCGRFGHYKEGCQETVNHSEESTRNQPRQEENVETNTLWTVVQKHRVNNRRRPPPNKTNEGSRYNVLATAEPVVAQETVLEESIGHETSINDIGEQIMNTQGKGVKFAAQQGDKRTSRGRPHQKQQPSTPKEHSKDSTKNWATTSTDTKGTAKVHTPMEITEKPKKSHNSTPQMVRYADYIVTDKEGNTTIVTQEISMGEHHENDPTVADAIMHHMEHLHQQLPQPPDKDVATIAMTHQTHTTHNHVEKDDKMMEAEASPNLESASAMEQTSGSTESL